MVPRHRAGWRRKWKITFQARRPDGLRPGGDPKNWRDWRIFMCWPLLFDTEQAAWDHAHSVDAFKNLRHLRKVSMSVDVVFVPPKSTPGD